MADQLPPVRRIVTGIGPDGRSRIIEDGPPADHREVCRAPRNVQREYLGDKHRACAGRRT